MPSDLNAWRDARNDLAALGVAREQPADGLDASLDASLDAEAATYFSRYSDFPPDFFKDTTRSRRDRVRRAFGDGEGWAARLLSSVDELAHFSLHAEHLDLPAEAADARLFLDRENVARWKVAILAAFRGPCRWRLELGAGGRVHCHVLADAAELPELPRGGRIVSPCESYLEAAVGYQLGPPMEYNAANLALWIKARRRGRLPRLAGARGIPQRRTWGRPSVLRNYFAFDPENEPDTDLEPTPSEALEAPLLGSVDNSPALALEAPQRPAQPTPRPFDQLAALLNSQPLLKTHTSARNEPSTRRVSRSCRRRRGARAPPQRPRPCQRLDLSPIRRNP